MKNIFDSIRNKYIFKKFPVINLFSFWKNFTPSFLYNKILSNFYRRPTTSNTISLKYRPVMDSPDSLLLFTQVPATRTQSREYLAIELKQKKIHVKWDIGDGRREASLFILFLS